MRKLLCADFRRLFRSKLFWLFSTCMFLLGLLPIDRWLSNKKYIASGYADVMWRLEDEFFSYIIAVFFLIAIMVAIFIGTEYAGGTMRNKLVVGQKRGRIYLSNLIVLGAAALIWNGIHTVVALCVGIPLLGMFSCGLSQAIVYMLLTLALSLTVTAIMLMLAMLCTNRSYSAIICLLLAIAFLVSAAYINSRLHEPEYYEGYRYLDTETGELIEEERQKNLNYLTGTKRLVYEELMDILPGGQLIQLCDMGVEDGGKLALYDLMLFVLFTGAGILFWKRKDLK